MRAVLLLALVVLSSCHGGNVAESVSVECPEKQLHFTTSGIESEYFSKWQALFDESERLERTDDGKIHQKEMLRVHNAFWGDVFSSCEAEAKKTGDAFFLTIAVLSEDGDIVEYYPMPLKPEYQCFTKKMIGKRYPAPPKGNYPIGFVNVVNEAKGTTSEACIKKLIEHVKSQAAP